MMNDNESTEQLRFSPRARPAYIPSRPLSEAVNEATVFARQEWFEYLPSGLPFPDYEPYGDGWFCDLLISRVSTILSTAVPPNEVRQSACGVTDVCFLFAVDLLSAQEPSRWLHHMFWVGQCE
jgi:hypothetical protein